ncbi:MFS transporter [Roseomonas arctica]|uniref:MFS transporter n=1 Tax=Plastoroseomonas arctica TaxID=1509237 RepID=A0AAF1KU78_9PROT|nr:MFS transporter [Plastoroseomonas arctica]MBR0655662.1 MFS transporter [Plastoroseomonas arctica]
MSRWSPGKSASPTPCCRSRCWPSPRIWRSNLMGACVYGAMIGSIAFLPIFLQAVRGLSPGQAGLVLLPLSVGGALGAVISGRLMLRTGRGMLWPRIGLSVAATMLVVIGTVAEFAPIWLMPILLGLTATGFGTSFPVGQTTVQVAAGPARLGAAAASVQFSRNLGAATGTAILGAVLFGGLALAGGEVAAMFARVIAVPGIVTSLAPADALALRHALVGAFSALFYTASAFTVAGAVLASRVPLQRF